MKKPKFIDDESRQQYQASLDSFLKVVNPKPHTEAEIERIKAEMRKERGL